MERCCGPAIDNRGTQRHQSDLLKVELQFGSTKDRGTLVTSFVEERRDPVFAERFSSRSIDAMTTRKL